MVKPNTYTRLQVHFVFAVKYRRALILPEIEEPLHKYITAIFQNNDHNMLAINSVADHIHFFAGLNPNQSISKLVELVKGDSSEFLNKQKLCNRPFHWQSGYGAFSHSYSQIDSVVKYIHNPKLHHKKQSFRNEYEKFLRKNHVEYDQKYLFADLLDE